MAYRLAADIGGTFTDIVKMDEATGEYQSTKVLTTNDVLTKGVVAGFDSMVDGDYSEVSSIVHGTTSGLNAVIERRGAKSALVTTKGFRDVYGIGRGNRPEMYNNQYKKPVPLIPRKDIYEVDERIAWDGEIRKGVETKELKELADTLRGKYEAVAVSFINAPINPENERLTVQFLRKELGDETEVVASYETAREIKEYERTSTTVLNAYIIPKLKIHLDLLSQELEQRGYKGPLYIMQSNGGVVKKEIAAVKAVQTLMSGPVGGAIGAAASGKENLLGVDMGGTSFDVSLLINGRLETSVNTEIERFPMLVPSVNILSVGAGGGSVAWTEGGGMRVGPISAGSNPGPVCYGNGGKQPTVTDANLILGHLDQENFLGGRMQLDEKGAAEAFLAYGKEHGLDYITAAEGALTIANNKMADAIRQITVRRGIDPREFALLAFGGAGPMHAALIAEELDIHEVIVPTLPGAFSAWGMLQADVRHDAVQTLQKELSETDPAAFEKIEQELRRELLDVLKQENIPAEKADFRKSLDMRYAGQEYAITVDIPEEKITVKDAAEHFVSQYQRLYGHSAANDPIEVVNARLTVDVTAEREQQKFEKINGTKDVVPIKIMRSIFGGKEYETGVYRREDLGRDTSLAGPAVIAELTATTVVPPDWTVTVDERGCLVLTNNVKEGE